MGPGELQREQELVTRYLHLFNGVGRQPVPAHNKNRKVGQLEDLDVISSKVNK